MKFPQLPVGRYFQWQGERYCKTGPVTAHASDGSRTLIPRSARIEPADPATETNANANPGTGIAHADVEAALAAFTGSLREYAASLEGPQRSALDAHIDAAEQAFHRALSPPGIADSQALQRAGGAARSSAQSTTQRAPSRRRRTCM